MYYVTLILHYAIFEIYIMQYFTIKSPVKLSLCFLIHNFTFSESMNTVDQTHGIGLKQHFVLDLDKFDFYIPKSPSLTKSNVNKDQQNLGNIDITHYLSQDEAQELQEIGVHVKLGEAKFCLAYDENNEKLRLILKCVDIFLKPSASVVGCNWACDTVTCFDVLQDKKKQIELKFGEEISIDIKKNELNDKTLRLTIFDVRRRHKKIPIGHVLVNIRDLTELSSKLKIYTRKINLYSQV